MNVMIELADFAKVSDGKLDMLGAGWNLKPPSTPFAIAWIIEVPWDKLGGSYDFEVRLLDSDANLALNPDGGPIFLLQGRLEAQRPDNVPFGTSLRYPNAVNVGPIAVNPGNAYRIEFAIDGETNVDWSRRFEVVPDRPMGV